MTRLEVRMQDNTHDEATVGYRPNRFGTYFKESTCQELMEVQAEAESLEPNDPFVLLSIANTCFDCCLRDAARERLSKIIELDSQYVDTAYLVLAMLDLECGKRESAEEHLRMYNDIVEARGESFLRQSIQSLQGAPNN